VIPLPPGTGIVPDPSLRRYAGGRVLVGGRPPRMVTLTPAGVVALDRLEAGPSPDLDRATLELGRRLVDAGMAHPRWLPDDAAGTDEAVAGRVTVVVPAHGRPERLARCLASLGRTVPVLVVDDGSPDPLAMAAECRRHGAALLRRPHQGGPGAARNSGIAATTTELVAFLDSDCEAPPDWLHGLVEALRDPLVGAAAPRIAPGPLAAGARVRNDGSSPLPTNSSTRAYASGRSPLDLGRVESEVGPGRRVTYVPTAALLVRRAAFGQPAPGSPAGQGVGVFDEALRYGEDVDFVWRLVESGWHVRYDPTVVVHHAEPTTWTALLARRYHYGTSAGPLARRHPGCLVPFEVDAVTATVATSALAGRWGVAATLLVTRAFQHSSGLRRSRAFQHSSGLRSTGSTGGPEPRTSLDPGDRRVPVSLWWSVRGTAGSLGGLGRWATTCGWPVLVALAMARWTRSARHPARQGIPAVPGARLRRSRRRASRARTLALVVLAAPRLTEWHRLRPALDPLRWVIASIADDMAYGAGVWVGSVRARTVEPLAPRLRRPVSRSGPP